MKQATPALPYLNHPIIDHDRRDAITRIALLVLVLYT